MDDKKDYDIKLTSKVSSVAELLLLVRSEDCDFFVATTLNKK